MDIPQLINLNIEIEGALRVYAERGSEEALALARSKAAELYTLLTEFEPEQEAAAEVSEEAPAAQYATEPQTVAEEAAEAIVLNETPAVSLDEPNDEPVDEPADEPEDEPTDEPEPQTETVIPSQHFAEPEPSESEAPTTPLRRIPIRNYLTINDKYLFRREVFDGNGQEFEDTLNLFEAMHSYAEAEEYIYEDLMLDRDNADVKAFMEIVLNYFRK